MRTSGKIQAIGVGLFGLLLFTSCKTTEVVVDAFTRVDQAHQIYAGELFGAGDEGYEKGVQLITNYIDWEALLTKTKRRKDILEALGTTTIDFNKEMVIAYFDGVRPTNGYTLTADSLLQSASSQIVFYTLTKPDGPAGEVLTQPFTLMAAPASSKQVELVLTEQ